MLKLFQCCLSADARLLWEPPSVSHIARQKQKLPWEMQNIKTKVIFTNTKEYPGKTKVALKMQKGGFLQIEAITNKTKVFFKQILL